MKAYFTFTEPLKKDPRFFVCGRGAIVNMENAADFQDAAFPIVLQNHSGIVGLAGFLRI